MKEMKTTPLDPKQTEAMRHGIDLACICKLIEDTQSCSALPTIKVLPGAPEMFAEFQYRLDLLWKAMLIETGVDYKQSPLFGIRREDEQGNSYIYQVPLDRMSL